MAVGIEHKRKQRSSTTFTFINSSEQKERPKSNLKLRSSFIVESITSKTNRSLHTNEQMQVQMSLEQMSLETKRLTQT